MRDDHQGRGVGSALLAAAAAGMLAAGFGWVQVTTTADHRVVHDMVRRRRPGVRPSRDVT